VPIDFAATWEQAEPFSRFLEHVTKLQSLWEGGTRNAKVPEWAMEKFSALPNGLRMLVINADWCLDSASAVPILACLAESVPGVELRVLDRDSNLEIMDQYLTNGTRSIPLVILLDRDFRELGRWGPRPVELQEFVRPNLERMSKEAIHLEIRKWYVADRGNAMLREMLEAVRA
jgi:thiol-disulfide isomerase/thioredoxin